MKRKWLALLLTLTALILTACGGQTKDTNKDKETESVDDQSTQTTTNESTSDVITGLAKIDSGAWQYNADDDVYYQIGIYECVAQQ